MFKPLSGAFKLPYSLEFHHRTTAFQGTFAHQFASRFTPLKSPRSRDNFFEKTVPCSGMKCSELTPFPAIYHVYTGFPRHTRPFPEFSNMLSPYNCLIQYFDVCANALAFVAFSAISFALELGIAWFLDLLHPPKKVLVGSIQRLQSRLESSCVHFAQPFQFLFKYR